MVAAPGAVKTVPSRPVYEGPQPEPPPLAIVAAYPDKGRASVNASTDALSGSPPARSASHTAPCAAAGAFAERLEPDRLPLAAASSETAIQAPRTWL